MNFSTFYSLVYNNKRTPFTWQIELAESLVKDKWANAISLPMASGKTTILEIWYYALCESIRRNNRNIPLRLWYIVDRKLLVDEAFKQAENLNHRLVNDPTLKEYVAPVLEHLEIEQPLVVARLRGGLDQSEKNTWVTTPNQPTIISSTVDQYGSRLMFRGYGVSSKTRSIHAGLTALDSLVVLDEAHLSKPFKDLIDNVFSNHVRRIGNVPPSRLIEVSATTDSNSIFNLNTDDEALRKRTEARRKVLIVSAKGELNAAMIEHANDLLERHKVIAIVCNTVKRAREIFKEIKIKNKTLIIGRVRAVERQRIIDQWQDKLKAGRDRKDDEPLVVVCTQTIEVGADFDFDGMVTEAAPLDCLIQRFGRLNRFGEIEGEGVIVHKASEKDHVYGDKTRETFDWLVENYPKKVIPNISLIERKKDLFSNCNATPTLTYKVLELIAHTYPSVDIDVHEFLHGVSENSRNEISVVYRKEITRNLLYNDPKKACKWVELMKPRNYEMVTIPISALRSEEFSDMEYQDVQVGKIEPLDDFCVVYREGRAKVKKLKHVRSGDVIVVPCDFARYDDHGWNLSEKTPVRDVYHQCGKNGGILCLHKNRVEKFLSEEVIEDIKLLDDEITRLSEEYQSGPIGRLLSKACNKAEYGYEAKLTPDKEGFVLFIYPRSGKKKRQNLNAHMRLVGSFASKFARTVGLPADLVEALRVAGDLHDLGKADPRFQALLYFPGKVNPEKLLAKSAKNTGKHASDFGAPKGWRHELQSVEMIKTLDSKYKSLIRHLIASHHGWFRNGRHLCHDSSFQSFECQGYKADIPYCEYLGDQSLSLFWTMNEKHGFWNLAFLESILRLADGEASRRGDQ